MYESLVFFSWCIVIAYLLITVKYQVPAVGAFVIPITFILMVAAAFLPDKGVGVIPPALKSYWLPIHVTFSFMGDALFAMFVGVLLLWSIMPAGLAYWRFATKSDF